MCSSGKRLDVVLCHKIKSIARGVYVVPASSAGVCGGKAGRSDSSFFSSSTAAVPSSAVLSFPLRSSLPPVSSFSVFAFLPSITSGLRLYLPPHPTH